MKNSKKSLIQLFKILNKSFCLSDLYLTYLSVFYTFGDLKLYDRISNLDQDLEEFDSEDSKVKLE